MWSTLLSELNSHPSSSSSSSLLGTRATMMEQSLAVMATRYWWTWSQNTAVRCVNSWAETVKASYTCMSVDRMKTAPSSDRFTKTSCCYRAGTLLPHFNTSLCARWPCHCMTSIVSLLVISIFPQYVMRNWSAAIDLIHITNLTGWF